MGTSRARGRRAAAINNAQSYQMDRDRLRRHRRRLRARRRVRRGDVQPERLQGRHRKAVKEKTGRTLQIKGDLGLSICPSIGMKLGQASLSERNSDREFASLGERGGLGEGDAALVEGSRSSTRRDERPARGDREGQGRQVQLRRPHRREERSPSRRPTRRSRSTSRKIEIADADVTYVDQAAGTRYRLSKLDLKTGRIASGVTTPIDLSAHDRLRKGQDAARHEVERQAHVRSRARSSTRSPTSMSTAKGNYGGITGMNATAKGSVEARLASGEYVDERARARRHAANRRAAT